MRYTVRKKKRKTLFTLLQNFQVASICLVVIATVPCFAVKQLIFERISLKQVTGYLIDKRWKCSLQLLFLEFWRYNYFCFIPDYVVFCLGVFGDVWGPTTATISKNIPIFNTSSVLEFSMSAVGRFLHGGVMSFATCQTLKMLQYYPKLCGRF